MSDRKTVVTLIGAIPPPVGGVSIHVHRFFRRTQKENDLDVAVLDIRKRILLKHTGTSEHFVDVLRHLAQSQIIHIHVSHALKLLLALTTKLLRKKFIYTQHNTRITSQRIFRLMLSVADKVILVNPQGACIPHKHRHKIAVIPAFVPPPDRSVELPSELSDALSAFETVLCSNATHPPRVSLIDGHDVYGFDLLIQAFALLVRKALIDRTILVLVDAGGHGRPIYERLIRETELGSSCRILYIAHPVDFVALMRRANVVVRPTRSDGDALTVREALWLSIPVVASDCTIRPDGVLLFRNNDYLDLADKICAALQQGTGAVHRFPDYAAQILALYRSLL